MRRASQGIQMHSRLTRGGKCLALERSTDGKLADQTAFERMEKSDSL